MLRVAAWVRDHPGPLFLALLVVALPVIVFGLADYTWFFRDDWIFIAERELSLEDVFEPHNAHWTSVPIVAFRVLYRIFGLHSYAPYLASVVALHLAVVALVRTIMVRAGVGGWTANAFAAALVFFGPGREDIIWAFQIGFTGAIAFTLGQLVLADHDGPVGRRDLLALGLGVLGLMSAGVAVVLVGVTGLALLVRRGWRRAALQTAPLAAVYVVYDRLADPANSSVPGFGPRVALDWVRHGVRAGFESLGRYAPVTLALVAVLVVGLAVHVLVPAPTAEPADHDDADDDHDADHDDDAADDTATAATTWWARVQQVASPLALFAGLFAFIVVVARSRSYLGPEGAAARRYVYFYGVAILPLLAVAADALVRRWRVTAPVVLLALVAVPANFSSFEDPPFGPAYHDGRRRVLLAVLALPESRQVDGEHRPIPDPFMGEGVTLDFLRRAHANGFLPDPPEDLPPVLRNEVLLRLALDQGPPEEPLYFCEPVEGGEVRVRLTDEVGFGISGPVAVQRVVDGEPVPPRLVLNPVDGRLLTGSAVAAEVELRPVRPGEELALCALP